MAIRQGSVRSSGTCPAAMKNIHWAYIIAPTKIAKTPANFMLAS
jgi:hypothetical protein